MLCVTSVKFIFETWTEVSNLHASFEHHQQDFRIPTEISPVHWPNNAWIFFYITAWGSWKLSIIIYCCLMYALNFFLFFFLLRFPKKSSRFHSNPRGLKTFISLIFSLGNTCSGHFFIKWHLYHVFYCKGDHKWSLKLFQWFYSLILPCNLSSCLCANIECHWPLICRGVVL